MSEHRSATIHGRVPHRNPGVPPGIQGAADRVSRA
jgi:hypothetical protein